MTENARIDAVVRRENKAARPPLIAGLLKGDAYSHPCTELRISETHGAWVLLTGPFAYKIKKPVNFGFLDYSTLEKRRFNCEEEVRLNRRFAPGIYLGVVPVTGTEQRPTMGGDGPVIEYAVKMQEFPAQGLLSQLAETGRLDEEVIDQIAEEVARFHGSAEVADAQSQFGDPDRANHWVIENFMHIRAAVSAPDELRKLASVERWATDEYIRLGEMLIKRKKGGFIRECHGDLHLRNMTLIDGKVTLFDCIEFNPELRWIDVISEVAFVVMDLEQRGLTAFAMRFLNAYLQETGDYEGLIPLRWYLMYRALVRAKVAVLRGSQSSDPEETARLLGEYRRYIDLASTYTRRQTPAMLLMYGLAGSGKTTAARWLCQQRGMIQLRSDVERKRLAGLAPLASSKAMPGEGLYGASKTEDTYTRLLELAGQVISAGYSVIVDATFLKRRYRQRFRELAERHSIPFVILSCEASYPELQRRVSLRATTGRDASEATPEILALQRNSREPLDAAELACCVQLDTETPEHRKGFLLKLDGFI